MWWSFSESRLQRDWRNERLIMALRGAGWGHRHRLIIANQIRAHSQSITITIIFWLFGLTCGYNTQKWDYTVIYIPLKRVVSILLKTIHTFTRVGKCRRWNITFGDVGWHMFYCLQEELQVSSGYCAVRYACTHGKRLPINGKVGLLCMWLMAVLITQHLESVLGYFKNLWWLCPDWISPPTFFGYLRGNRGNQK